MASRLSTASSDEISIMAGRYDGVTAVFFRVFDSRSPADDKARVMRLDGGSAALAAAVDDSDDNADSKNITGSAFNGGIKKNKPAGHCCLPVVWVMVVLFIQAYLTVILRL